MRYENMKLTEKELNSKNLIKTDNQEPCSECMTETHYIDYCTERRICGEECMTKQNKWLNEKCRDYEDILYCEDCGLELIKIETDYCCTYCEEKDNCISCAMDRNLCTNEVYKCNDCDTYIMV